MSHIIVPVAFVASTFATDSSKALRIGDCIVTRPAASMSKQRSTKHKLSQLQSPLPLDTSSEKALWQSLNPNTTTAAEEDQKAKITSMGVVTQIDRAKSKITVSVWKRGEEYFVTERPTETYPLSQVLKVSRSEFFKQCKRPFMEQKYRQLELKAESQEDDMPLSLMAYNNRIISELLDRTHNKKSKVLDDPLSGIREELHKVTMETGTAYGKRKKKQGLQGSPGQSGTPEKNKYSIESSPKATSETTPLSFLLSENPMLVENAGRIRPSSKMGRLLSTLTNATGAELASDMVIRRDRLHTTMQTDGMLACGRLGFRSPTPIHEDPRTHPRSRILSTTMSSKKLPISASTGVISAMSSAQPSVDSSLDQPAQSLASISAISSSKVVQQPTFTYTVLEVFERGKFLVSHDSGVVSLNVPAPRFLATFEGLVVPHTAELAGTGCSPVRFLEELMKNQVMEAAHYGHDARGVIKLDVTLGSAWVQGLLVDAGLARCAFSHLDSPENLISNGPEKELHHFSRLDDLSCKNLHQRQRTAQSQRVGMWALPSAFSNFITNQIPSGFVEGSSPSPSPTPSTVSPLPPLTGRGTPKPDTEAVLPALLIDQNEMDEPVLSSLFDLCESSEVFRQRLDVLRTKNAGSGSFRFSHPGTPVS